MNEISKYFAAESVVCEMCEEGTVELRPTATILEYGPAENQVEIAVEIPVWECDRCGCSYEAEDAVQIKHAAVCRHLGVLEPHEIRDIRGRLGLTQDALSNVTSIGIASIKRWESSKTVQNKAMDNLLRLLLVPGSMEQLAKSFSASIPVFRTNISDEQKQAAAVFSLR